MYTKKKIALKYIQYLLRASNGKGHGVHPPFLYDFIRHVLNSKENPVCFKEIENERKSLMANDQVITIEDFGAGSRIFTGLERKISGIARTSLKPAKYSRLLYHILAYYKPRTSIELGTSLGITASYLAKANPNGKLITMEGSAAIASIAKNTFSKLSIENIEVAEGNFDQELPRVLKKNPVIDFAFIDGNHSKEPTIRYFNMLLPHLSSDSILVFDDIHWSEEMEAAWEAIRASKEVRLTIDLFFVGIAFFKKELISKADYSVRY
ncbi:MAG: class I SAM-dependent methyltransferase [Bacteroidetes bacterium]|mgnify:CR=1 FL=1|nr:class I SAM-dependent methyltransferase [Bacteroidota bacterium]